MRWDPRRYYCYRSEWICNWWQRRVTQHSSEFDNRSFTIDCNFMSQPEQHIFRGWSYFLAVDTISVFLALQTGWVIQGSQHIYFEVWYNRPSNPQGRKNCNCDPQISPYYCTKKGVCILCFELTLCHILLLCSGKYRPINFSHAYLLKYAAQCKSTSELLSNQTHISMIKSTYITIQARERQRQRQREIERE